jgi:AcrR family transcriptional regulator
MSPRVGLDTRTVVEAAVELVNSEGPEALALNRLAAKLGVRTPSLYNHIGGLASLRLELARLNARQLAERLGEATIAKSGTDAVIAMAQAFRGYIKEQPGLYLVSLQAAQNQTTVDTDLKAAEDRVVKIVLAVIATFGLSGEDALHAVRGLRSVVHGFTTLEVAGGFGLPLDCDESFRRLLEILIYSLQPAVGNDVTNMT